MPVSCAAFDRELVSGIHHIPRGEVLPLKLNQRHDQNSHPDMNEMKTSRQKVKVPEVRGSQA